MFKAENIREWLGQAVVDRNGDKIGSLESIYVDTVSDQPSFVAVTTGLPTRHRLVFAPLTDATVGPGYLKIQYAKKLVRSAPSIDTDGELTVEREPSVFEHYDLSYEAGARGERRLARR
ncbi:PRC-barrel domain-containing protein [Streptomyces oceani]|uniref:Photosystem reaction center subunit H n=1 Tax=Streptomyces oceani TaxID=1075402 RepID=A0A1E7KFR7_9ACTN|nr:PRC-barrel domain-containing protein [Streptomyces oceani]OEV02782.1 photosystem reaction center subunit H [Streptomyces oceani]